MEVLRRNRVWDSLSAAAHLDTLLAFANEASWQPEKVVCSLSSKIHFMFLAIVLYSFFKEDCWVLQCVTQPKCNHPSSYMNQNFGSHVNHIPCWGRKLQAGMPLLGAQLHIRSGDGSLAVARKHTHTHTPRHSENWEKAYWKGRLGSHNFKWTLARLPDFRRTWKGI